jgi:hypothetical protein
MIGCLLDDLKNLVRSFIPVEVHPPPTPMIGEMAALNRFAGQVRVEKADAFTSRKANAGVDQAIRTDCSKLDA